MEERVDLHDALAKFPDGHRVTMLVMSGDGGMGR